MATSSIFSFEIGKAENLSATRCAGKAAAGRQAMRGHHLCGIADAA